MSNGAVPVQHISNGNPRVVASDGTLIEVPTSVKAPDGSELSIGPDAKITVIGSRDRGYRVVINLPSKISGDTRMVLLAAGFGTFGGAAKTLAARQGYSFTIKFVAKQIASRIAGFVIGMILPNTTAHEVFIEKQFENGAMVVYTIIG